MKDAFIRREKAEEEYTELNLKSRTLEIDLDKYGEKLEKQVFAQEGKEAQVVAAEAEFNRLNRRFEQFTEYLNNVHGHNYAESRSLRKIWKSLRKNM